MQLNELSYYTQQLLECDRFQDYCPNGLQVEGRAEVKHIVTGVTACQALLDAAVACQADAILVHHGYFWKNEAAVITGMKKRRLQTLLQDDISLLAYHLPLDAHPILGNNAQLGAQLGLSMTRQFAEYGLGYITDLAEGMPLKELKTQLEKKLGRSVLQVGESSHLISCIAWCTGAAQNYLPAATAAGAQVFISGEISESTTHWARENSVIYIAAGHHATERYGIQALGTHLAQHFGIQHTHIDIDNPV